MKSISAIILTKNEGLHIHRCISNIKTFCDDIVVIDSGSEDNTVAIAKSLGARVFHNDWINYATQFNWGLNNTNISSTWCLRIDADEYLDKAAVQSLVKFVTSASSVQYSGATINRCFIFNGRQIRWGGIGSIPMLRLFRLGEGVCENRWMDEHITVTGQVYRGISGKLIDENLRPLSWWIEKHNSYANREAIDRIIDKYGLSPKLPDPKSARTTTKANSSARIKRAIKVRLYNRLPTPLGPCLYFIFRYLFLFGFLDGKDGLAFHGLQGLWYRYLVDLKQLEIENHSIKNNTSIQEAIYFLHKVNIANNER